MKKTAVEWLIQELKDFGYYTYSLEKLCEQAKEMEKEQIINAWIATDNELQRISAEKYYNETFKLE